MHQGNDGVASEVELEDEYDLGVGGPLLRLDDEECLVGRAAHTLEIYEALLPFRQMETGLACLRDEAGL